MKTFVVDSSTSLKWVFRDEIYSREALNLQEKYLEGTINLIAPDLWLYEIINGLRNAHLKKSSLSTKSLNLKLTELIDSSPNLMNISDLSGFCLKYSFRYNISSYDSAYLTLAHAYGLTLITADDKLATKINDPTLAISLKEFKMD